MNLYQQSGLSNLIKNGCGLLIYSAGQGLSLNFDRGICILIHFTFMLLYFCCKTRLRTDSSVSSCVQIRQDHSHASDNRQIEGKQLHIAGEGGWGATYVKCPALVIKKKKKKSHNHKLKIHASDIWIQAFIKRQFSEITPYFKSSNQCQSAGVEQ